MRVMRSRRGRAGGPMQLRMVPMIDVVFLLLVFFLLTANFRSREGFLPAELPQRVTRAEVMEIEPLVLRIDTLVDGGCHVQVGSGGSVVVSGGDAGGFAAVGGRLREVLEKQGRTVDDPIKLMPTYDTKWDHVVKAYDAVWQLDVRNVIFGVAE